MDPLSITLIVNALVAGATSSIKNTASKAMTDAYRDLKMLLVRKFAGKPSSELALEVLNKFEEKPEIWQAPLKDELIQVNADKDQEVIATAKRLIELVKSRQQATYEHIAIEADTLRKELERSYEQRLKQAKLWTNLSLITAVVGFLFVIIGTVVVLVGYTSSGILAFIVSIIPELTSGLFFLQARAANKRVDYIREQLHKSERVYQTIALSLMTDDETQGRLKELIIKQLLNLSTEGQEMSPIDLTQQLSSGVMKS